MRLRGTQPPYKQFNAELVPAQANIPGNLAIKRLDTQEVIALRDLMGVPHAPGSTVKYQLLEVTQEEKNQLEKEGLMVAATIEDYRQWWDNWTGPKPTQKAPF